MSQKVRNDFENLVSLLSILIVLGLLGLVYNFSVSVASRLPQHSGKWVKINVLPADPAKRREVDSRFNQAVALLHAKKYDYAITALRRVIELAPNMPEAYVNLGFAHIDLKQYGDAVRYFNRAVDLKPDQVNAYWGLALAAEGMNDYEVALGAMRSFIHLSDQNEPLLPKARAALWEWEAILGRIPGVSTPGDPAEKGGKNIPEPYKLLRPGYKKHSKKAP